MTKKKKSRLKFSNVTNTLEQILKQWKKLKIKFRFFWKRFEYVEKIGEIRGSNQIKLKEIEMHFI